MGRVPRGKLAGGAGAAARGLRAGVTLAAASLLVAASCTIRDPALTASSRQPLSGGDSCADFASAPEGVLITGTTEGASDDFRCLTGPDVVYAFDPSATGAYQLLLLYPDGGMVPPGQDQGVVPFLSGNICDAGVCLGGPRNSFNFRATAGTRQFFILESSAPTPYAFDLHPITPPANDDCGQAAPLQLGVPATVEVSSAFDDFPYPAHAGCGISFFADVVFSFDPPASGRYEFSADAGILFFSQGTCAENCSRAAQLFSVDLTAGVPAYLVLESLARVDTVHVQAVVPPYNDTCATAAALAPGASVHGSTRFALQDQGCPGGPGGPDVAYRVDVPAGGAFTARVRVDAGVERPAIYALPGGCGTGSCLGSTALDSVSFRVAPGVPLYLVVQGGPWPVDFDVELQPLTIRPGDSCAAPLPLQLGVPREVSFEATLDDYQGPGCGRGDSADVTFSFTPARAGRYELSTSAGELYLSRLTCAAGCEGPTTDATLDLAAGETVYLVLEALGAGGATVLAREAPPPPNDTCAGAAALQLGVPVNGTTRGSNDQVCGAWTDVLYAFVSADGGTFVATVSTRADSGSPAEPSIRRFTSGACGPGTCEDSWPDRQQLRFNAAAGVPFFLALETVQGNVDFSVRVDPAASVRHDTCADPAVLTEGVPLVLPVGELTDDYPGPGAPCGFGGSPELVAAFTAPVTGLYAFSASSGTLLFEQGGCGQRCGFNQPWGLYHLDAGATSSLLVELPQAPSLTLQARYVPPPPNLSCATPQVLSLGAPVISRAAGAWAPDCTFPPLYYRFTPDAGGVFRVRTQTLEGAPLAGGELRRLQGCPQRLCESQYGVVSTTFRADAGETQLLALLDVAAPREGRDFAVVVEEVTPPANDTCAGAIPLTLGVPVHYSLAEAADDFPNAQVRCGGPAALDLLFSFTPQFSGPYRLVATHSAAFNEGICSPRRLLCGFLDSMLEAGVPYDILVEWLPSSTWGPEGEIRVIWDYTWDPRGPPDGGDGGTGSADGGRGPDGGAPDGGPPGAGGAGAGQGCGCSTGAGGVPPFLLLLGLWLARAGRWSGRGGRLP